MLKGGGSPRSLARQPCRFGSSGSLKQCKVLGRPPSSSAGKSLTCRAACSARQLVMIAVQFTIILLPEQAALDLVRMLAFIPARYSGAAAELPGGYPACVTSFVTYMIVHAGWLHLGVNLAWMVAFGSAVAQTRGRPDLPHLLHPMRHCRGADASRLPCWRHGAGGRRVRRHFRSDGGRAQIRVRGDAAQRREAARRISPGRRSQRSDRPSATRASSSSSAFGWPST